MYVDIAQDNICLPEPGISIALVIKFGNKYLERREENMILFTTSELMWLKRWLSPPESDKLLFNLLKLSRSNETNSEKWTS